MRYCSDMSTPTSDHPQHPETEALACRCGHGLIWHDPRQGCGYLGFNAAHRCSCLLPFHEAVREALAQAWDQGKAAGFSRAMRYMSDEPSVDTNPPNPFRRSSHGSGTSGETA